MDTNQPEVVSHPPPQTPAPMKLEFDPVIEEALYQMRSWFSDLYPPAQADRALTILDGKPTIKGKIWTTNNEFTIIAQFKEVDMDEGAHVGKEYRLLNKSRIIADGYLGAQATSRKSRTGEDWHRGNDRSDGKFNEETWIRIIKSILAYEIEDIQSDAWKKPPRFKCLVS